MGRYLDPTDALALLLAMGGMALLRRGLGGFGRGYVPLELQFRGERVSLTALRDTGNGLHDPVTGEGVLVIGTEAARTLTGLTRHQLRDPLGTLASAPMPGLRLIPYKTVGGTGLLLALRLPGARLGRKRADPLVAFAPEGLDGEFQALTGGDI